MKEKIGVFIVFIVLFSNKIFSHDPALFDIRTLIISSSINYNMNISDYSNVGLDLQYLYKLMSTGLNYRTSPSGDCKDELNMYLGLCFSNVFQVQFGYATLSNNCSYRIRSDIIVFGDNDGFLSNEGKWFVFKKGLDISIIYEKYITRKNYNFIGVGVGLTL